MALDQHALLDLLKELQLTETTDQIRAATQRLYQELIDAEATAFIGAAAWQRSDERTATQRLPCSDARDADRGPEAADREAPGRELLLFPAGAPTPGRQGPLRGGDGGVSARDLDRAARGARRAMRWTRHSSPAHSMR